MAARLYFAYGSNLLGAEIRATCPSAEAVGVAYVPGWRVLFDKHSVGRGGDAANLSPDESHRAWGTLYRIADADREALRMREGGYDELEVQSHFVADPADPERFTPMDAFTFVAKQSCQKGCGPSDAYLQIVLDGAVSRGLPDAHISDLRSRPTRRIAAD